MTYLSGFKTHPVESFCEWANFFANLRTIWIRLVLSFEKDMRRFQKNEFVQRAIKWISTFAKPDRMTSLGRSVGCR